MSDDVRLVAFDSRAPADERQDALAQLTKAHAPRSIGTGLSHAAGAFVQDLREQFAVSQAMNKAMVIDLPADAKRRNAGGMQSVYLDKWQIFTAGEYFEKPAPAGFDTLRSMVDQVPILSAIVLTRLRQVQRYCIPQERDDGNPGFSIVHLDPEHTLTSSEQESVNLLRRFVSHCGWEFNPRARKRLKRDNFSQFMGKLTRDSLTMDAAPIETEFKKDKKQGIDGLYAVDGATIRLCSEDGYQGDDEIFAVQTLNSRIVTAYTHDDLIYEPRNPRSDVRLAGYGLGETELLIRVVTGFLNAMTHNIRGFDENSIPRGLLHLSGDYSNDDLAAFRRYWNAMVKGVNNSWSLPVLVSKDQESKASFENFGIEFNEMYFAKWMTFLTSLACAIYGMSPQEINFDSFTGGNTSALSGSDTAEKIAHSEDKGLRPLLSYFEGILSDFVIADFSDKFAFRWTGLDPEDPEKLHEKKKLVLTVNEMRAEMGHKKADGDWGDAPLNPSLVGVWQQAQQAAQQDFGQMPGQDGQPGQEGGMPGQDGQPQTNTPPPEAGAPPAGTDAGGEDRAGDFGQDDGDERQGDFGKALRIWGIE
jgi:hypothetical protein